MVRIGCSQKQWITLLITGVAVEEHVLQYCRVANCLLIGQRNACNFRALNKVGSRPSILVKLPSLPLLAIFGMFDSNPLSWSGGVIHTLASPSGCYFDDKLAFDGEKRMASLSRYVPHGESRQLINRGLSWISGTRTYCGCHGERVDYYGPT